jgi:Uma2 family endonuclease
MPEIIPSDSFATVGELLEALGGIAPDRVRLHPPPGTATESDLIEFNERKLTLCELVDGVLVEKGMGLLESILAGALGTALQAPAVGSNLGIMTGPDGPMRLRAGLVRLPDLAYASWTRIPGRRLSWDPIADFAPDLAVEILNLNNTPAEMARKRREYFGAGVRLVWEIDLRARTVAVYDAPEQCTLLDTARTLDGGDVLPGFALPLAYLFGELDRQRV